jgi:FtsH-binding integral membrane protein
VSPALAQTLQIIAGAMAAGLLLMAGLVFWSFTNAETKAPTAESVRFINLLTGIGMAMALGEIVASEILWRRLLRSSTGPLNSRVQGAFVVRLALREGAALTSLTFAYLAALNGVLKAYPAYWVNAIPSGLFLSFLAVHWPSAERLTAEVRDILSSGPVLPQ